MFIEVPSNRLKNMISLPRMFVFFTLVLVFGVSFAIPANTPTNANPNLIPKAPELSVQAYVLMDAGSGNVIASKNPDLRTPPASLTKIMSLYLVADALKSGKIKITDQVPISEKAWRMEGSRMFAKVGSTIPVQQMIDGVAIASGNDATLAIAEYIGGTEESFVDLMNQHVALLNLKNTHFADSSGLDKPGHYSSAFDIAFLSRAFVTNFPEYYPWFGTKWIAYNGIKQPNRNRLLWRDPSVDGIKTGYTKTSGYCLAASAVKNGVRLIAVVMNAPSESVRTNSAAALLNYGFHFYESHMLYKANTKLVMQRVWFGKEKTVPLGLSKDLYVTVPIGEYKNMKVNVKLRERMIAPIKKGEECGVVYVSLGNRALLSQKLIALNDVKKGGIFTQLTDRIRLFFSKKK